MPIQFPQRINYMDPARIEQSVQQSEWNELRNQGVREEQQRRQQTFDAETGFDNARWGAAATDYALKMGPQWSRSNFPAFWQEGVRRGMWDAEGIQTPDGQTLTLNDIMMSSEEDFMNGFQRLGDEFRMQVAGGRPGRSDRRDETADIQNYEYLAALTPEQREMWWRMKRGQPGLRLEKIPRGDGTEQVVVWDEERGVGFDLQGNPLTGGIVGTEGEGVAASSPPGGDFGVTRPPEEQAAATERAKYLAKLEIDDERSYKEGLQVLASNINDAELAIGNIDDAIGSVNWWSTGIPGQILDSLGSTDARELRNRLQPVLAALAFDRLQQMRDASKTGGALGQVSERELDLLMRARFAIDQATSGDELIRGLMKARGHYENVRRIHRAQMLLETGQATFVKTEAEAAQLPPGTVIVNAEGYTLRTPSNAG